MKNTAMTLTYYDASNWKSKDIRLVFRGEITPCEIKAISEKLEDGMLFPRQIGLPTPTLGAFNEDDDDVFSTWVEIQDGLTANQMHTDEPAMFLIDIHCLVWRILAVTQWDIDTEWDIRQRAGADHEVAAAEYWHEARREEVLMA